VSRARKRSTGGSRRSGSSARATWTPMRPDATASVDLVRRAGIHVFMARSGLLAGLGRSRQHESSAAASPGGYLGVQTGS
jgi:hypothetical protein